MEGCKVTQRSSSKKCVPTYTIQGKRYCKSEPDIALTPEKYEGVHACLLRVAIPIAALITHLEVNLSIRSHDRRNVGTGKCRPRG
jgi:hypothetical protein